jgi:drug/metabolite transporter (DMT)-like permease
MMNSENLKKCAAWMTLSSLSFSIMALLIKMGAKDLPESVLIFFRSGVMLILVIALLLWKKTSPRSPQWKWLLLRGVAGSCAIYFYVHAIAKLDLSRAVLITSTAPLFVVFISWVFLKEKIQGRTIFWMIVAIIGVMLITDPFHGTASSDTFLGVIFGLASSACAGVAYTTLRSLGGKVKSEVIVFNFAAIATLFSLPSAYIDLKSMTLPTDTYAELVGIGFFGFLGQVFMTYGYRHASATKASSLGLLSILFSTVWGVLFLKEEPNLVRGLGMSLVLLGILFIGSTPTSAPTSPQK